MKTPVRQTYTFPTRYTVSDVPYQIDWSTLMEDGETVTSVDLEMVRGDTVVDRESTVSNVTTFWLSGGTGAMMLHQIRAACTTSLGETEAILITIGVSA